MEDMEEDMRIGGRKIRWGNMLPIFFVHIVAGYAVWAMFFRGGFSSIAWAFFVTLYVLTALGVTLGYHRFAAHGSFKSKNKPFIYALFVLGGMAQGQAINWVANHRVHHMYEDQPGMDPHTPREFFPRNPSLFSRNKRFWWTVKGLWWSHIGWFFVDRSTFTQREVDVATRKFLDKSRTNPLIVDAAVWQAKHLWFLVVLFGFVLPGLMAGLVDGIGAGVLNGIFASLDAVVLAGFFRMVCTLHVPASVNSLGHLVGRKARHRKECKCVYEKSHARNCGLLIPFSAGEWGHGNHHYDPTCAYFAPHSDPGKWALEGLKRFGLVYDVNKEMKPRHCPVHG